MTTDLPAALRALCQDLFPRDAEKLTATTPFTDIYGWDSLARISLLLGVEKAFALRITTPEAAKLRSMEDLIALIDEKKKGPNAGYSRFK